MDEAKIRQIVQQELAKQNNKSRFGIQSIPNHKHDGVDSLQIKAEDVLPSVSVSGSIEMAQTTIYTLNLNSLFTPRNISAYGVITGNYLGSQNRIITYGTAQLTPSFYFQPSTSTSVKTGDIEYPFPTAQPDGTTKVVPMQSSAYFSTNRGSVARTYAGISEDHIVDAVFPDPTLTTDIKARVTVIGYNRNAVIVSVPYLSSGWTIYLNFLIT